MNEGQDQQASVEIISQMPTLDMAAFGAFRELMENSLSEVLITYFEVAEEYIKSIQGGVESGNLKAAYKAAHPFKSSSKQIGALKVAALAKEIEHGAAADIPNLARLKILGKLIEKAQSETVQILKPFTLGFTQA